MIQNYLGIPFGANIVMAIALLILMSFTASRVLATVPAAALSASAPAKTSQVLTKEQYSGVVSWVTKSSIRITDTYGVSRVFTFDESTKILKNGAEAVELTYTDIKALGHVRVSTLKGGTDELAQVVLVL